ncbi:hypothetical protein RDI86_01375 [Cellulosimicrobium sp. XJ-DQ-B-000]|uniref:hypothetical protein n=1 Tax=Cellulosimicrobium sp. XJ-DQ-B-000 TaxID=3072182 RepID=UPI0028071082|nr:hypothetical protein [Cellulosimicrobium sp. XJ-DQ-B-000]MDQ8040499.1 hypothetical protein [Cellulosimicrobium sp. XJ-DQ-B-000]
MSTPALARATEALLKVTIIDPESTERYAERLARATVSAALHDPADDVIARTLGAHRVLGGQWGGRGARWALRCTCGWETTWTESRRERIAEHEGHAADAVRAAILGEVA